MDNDDVTSKTESASSSTTGTNSPTWSIFSASSTISPSVPSSLTSESSFANGEGSSFLIPGSDEEDCSYCYGYGYQKIRSICFYVACLCSGGLLYLVSYWKPEWKVRLTHERCNLGSCDIILIKDPYGKAYVEKITSATTDANTVQTRTTAAHNDKEVASTTYRFFIHKHYKYVFDEKEKSFKQLSGLIGCESVCNIYNDYRGVYAHQRTHKLHWFGKNSINVEVKSYGLLFVEECANPFYIFQLCSCCLWFWDGYLYYACIILLISIGSAVLSIIQTRINLITLRRMIAHSDDVTVLTPDNELEQISSLDLVPGDVIVLPKNRSTLHCDAILLCGTVIVNESSLTGESLPVTKTALPRTQEDVSEPYDAVKNRRNTLFAGTSILQTRYYDKEHVLAVVVETGFCTSKGKLLRSILFPKPVGLEFKKDALKFVAVLGAFALTGLVYSIYMLHEFGTTVADIIDKSLDIITIAVPPSLPAALSVGTIYALKRLKERGIFCISPSRINVSGLLDLFCFDKTGTLTEDGVDFCGFVRAEDFNSTKPSSMLKQPCNTVQYDNSVVGMATCHCLTIIDKELTGDPLDIKMFQATGWDMEEMGEEETERYGMVVPTIVRPKTSGVDVIGYQYLDEDLLSLQVAILRHFPFSSNLQRMSVIARRLHNQHMEVYVKGSPEVVATLCDATTLPSDFDECLSWFTTRGYRVLALAYKTLPQKLGWHKIQKLRRERVECDLRFLGLVVMRNVLKPETTPVIRQLYEANIRVVVVTGDNILTACCVARECGIVRPSDKIIHITLAENGCDAKFTLLGEINAEGNADDLLPTHSSHHIAIEPESFRNRSYHFAVTGEVFSVLQRKFPQLYSKLLVCGTVFSRMLPDQKTMLVEGLQAMGYRVGMCGDGANDCGALKRAHTGISLSNLEASAASPFTSQKADISCVTKVIKEGRCAIVTCFSTFKFMALYSMIQYATALLLLSIASNIGELQYLYIDLFIITPFVVTMGRTGPSRTLAARQPIGRLMHPHVMCSVVLQTTTQVVFQVALCFFVKRLPEYKPIWWFKPKVHASDYTQILSFENTVLFTFANFQYIIVALVFSVGKPFRLGIQTNKFFLVSVLLLSVFNVCLVVKPAHLLRKSMEVLSSDNLVYYGIFFTLLLLNFIISYCIDHVLLNNCTSTHHLSLTTSSSLPDKDIHYNYKVVEKDLENDPSWPPYSTLL